jgi:hypothetical protein
MDDLGDALDSASGTTGWDNSAFQLGGSSYLLQYKPAVGTAKIVDLRPDEWAGNDLGEEVYVKTWQAGWATVVFTMGSSSSYFLQYKPDAGDSKIVRLDRNTWGSADLGDEVYTKAWGTGWENTVLYVGASTYLLQYKPASGGDTKIVRLVTSEWADDDLGETVYTKSWSAGWTNVPLTIGSAVYLLQYKPSGGDAKIVRLVSSQWADDDLGDEVYSTTWTDGWSNVFFTLDGKPYLLQYKPGIGDAKIVELDTAQWEDDDLGDEVYTKSWGTGWANAVFSFAD